MGSGRTILAASAVDASGRLEGSIGCAATVDSNQAGDDSEREDECGDQSDHGGTSPLRA
jgi:hypothetical protein